MRKIKYIPRFLVLITLTALCLSMSAGKAYSIMENKFIEDFYPVKPQMLEQAWSIVAGPNASNIPYIKAVAKKFNLNPIDLATILTADVASRIAWPGGIPVEVPFGFVFSPSGLSQIPPGMAVSNRIIRGDLISPGARNRFQSMQMTTLQPEKGVDYWFRALSDEAYERMNDPVVNIGVCGRYVRRVADAGLDLFLPDARESIMLKEDEKKLLLPDQDFRWVQEFDWGRLRNYLRDQMLWDRSYEFDLTELMPSDKRWGELNLMIVYSEYRTSPPFDGSWFFESMNLVRETRRWIDTQDNILAALEPVDGKPQLYREYVEDYSFYQNEGEILNPGMNNGQDENGQNDDENKDKDTPKKKPGRKPRGQTG